MSVGSGDREKADGVCYLVKEKTRLSNPIQQLGQFVASFECCCPENTVGHQKGFIKREQKQLSNVPGLSHLKAHCGCE